MTSKDSEYSQLLDQMLGLYTQENQFLEFKMNFVEVDRLGQYISALSNGACLQNQEKGYLFMGIDDDTHDIKGSTFNYLTQKALGNQDLELYLRRMVEPRIDFKFEDFQYNGETRIVVLSVPAAEGAPTTYKKIPYIRINSQTTSLLPYTDWLRTIYNSQTDWTKQIVEEATLEDLDPDALRIAKEGYLQRFPNYADEAPNWDTTTFLDKARLTINGKITRTTLLLVGKPESVHLLNHISQIVWRLQSEEETASDIFTIPYLLSTDNLLHRIRNYRIKIFPQNSLIPADVWKYDIESILEALYNCIAHQDYTLNRRVVVTEHPDELIFSNYGSFFEGRFEDYFTGTKTPTKYRNPFLTQAMVNLKMIDTQGYGIHKIFQSQRKRFLPMPQYEQAEFNQVILHIPGAVLNADYSRLLMEHADITLTEAYLLDRVQRRLPITADALKMLRKKQLVEGRASSLFISSSVAQITKQKAQYSKNKGLDDNYYKQLILKAIEDNGTMSRQEINDLLWTKLPEILTPEQKTHKISYLLAILRKAGKIQQAPKKLWVVKL